MRSRVSASRRGREPLSLSRICRAIVPSVRLPYVFASWQMVESLSRRFSWRRLWVCSHLFRPTRPSDMLKGARICTSHGSQIDGTVPLTVESTSPRCPPERIDLAIVLAALSALRLAALRASRARSASARARSSALSCSGSAACFARSAAFASAEPVALVPSQARVGSDGGFRPARLARWLLLARSAVQCRAQWPTSPHRKHLLSVSPAAAAAAAAFSTWRGVSSGLVLVVEARGVDAGGAWGSAVAPSSARCFGADTITWAPHARHVCL